ncbi:MAG: dephospho-CoA kinase [Methylotetracoccus sp.]
MISSCWRCSGPGSAGRPCRPSCCWRRPSARSWGSHSSCWPAAIAPPDPVRSVPGDSRLDLPALGRPHQPGVPALGRRNRLSRSAGPGPLRIGLTGGIGSGKSAVASLFERLGVPTIDADRIARDLTQPGTATFDAIVTLFGPGILREGQIDRRTLRERIFRDPFVRREVEAIIHPAVYEAIRCWLESVVASYAILSVPLLLETGHRHWVDRLLVVDCSVDTQIARVSIRDDCSVEQVRSIIASQVSRELRLTAADDIIDNDGPIDRLEPQVVRLHSQYLALAAEGH